MASRFDVVEQGPPIEVFQLNKLFLDDPNQVKVNLTVGGKAMLLLELFFYTKFVLLCNLIWFLPIWILKLFFLISCYFVVISCMVAAYRDENGKPWVLPVVRSMEQQLAADQTLLHEYLPVLGKCF